MNGLHRLFVKVDENLLSKSINATKRNTDTRMSAIKKHKNKIYKTIILPGECETWSLTLREEHRLKMSEKRVLRRLFGPKRDEVTGGWRKLHSEVLHNLYSSPYNIRMIKPRMR
jgi:hypothetical protein